MAGTVVNRYGQATFIAKHGDWLRDELDRDGIGATGDRSGGPSGRNAPRGRATVA